MRPEISDIVKKMTCPGLRDDQEVLHRPHVLGLATDVVFISQKEHELSTAAMGAFTSTKNLSKSNVFESRLAIQVVRYLQAQGYQSNKIVILTPYLGQVRIIKNELNEAAIGSIIGNRDENDLLVAQGIQQPDLVLQDSNGVRVSSIDNYQGEEAYIILAS